MKIRALFVLAAFTPRAAGAVAGYASPTEIEVSCQLQFDECTDEYRLNVGDTWLVEMGGGALAQWDNYFDGGDSDCAAGYFAGTIASSHSLVIYVGNVNFGDAIANFSGFLQVVLEVFKYANSDCTGATTLLGSDYVGWTTPIGIGQQVCYADSKADCEGAFGDPGGSNHCHLADVHVSRPAGSGSQAACYLTKIWNRECEDSTQQNCTIWDSDTGTTVVQWQ